MRYWQELLREQREGFEVIVDKTWEDVPLQDLFDTSIDPETNRPYYDVQDMAQRIDSGELDYFRLRARVLIGGHELGSSVVCGCLYEDARDTLTDGVSEDLIWEAMRDARTAARSLARHLQQALAPGAAAHDVAEIQQFRGRG